MLSKGRLVFGKVGASIEMNRLVFGKVGFSIETNRLVFGQVGHFSGCYPEYVQEKAKQGSCAILNHRPSISWDVSKWTLHLWLLSRRGC